MKQQNVARRGSPSVLRRLAESATPAAVRFLLTGLIPLAIAFALAGCASPNKELAKFEEAQRQENSRKVEEMRMRAVARGDEVQSERGAEVMQFDPTKEFDMSKGAFAGGRTYDAGKARTKDFVFADRVRADSFRTRDFYGAKKNSAADRNYATTAARTRKYAQADKKTGDKTASTKKLVDGDKAVAADGLRDRNRPYLGKESEKMKRAVTPAEMADWRSGGGESVRHAGTTVETSGSLKQLSIQDVRDILNKNR